MKELGLVVEDSTGPLVAQRTELVALLAAVVRTRSSSTSTTAVRARFRIQQGPEDFTTTAEHRPTRPSILRRWLLNVEPTRLALLSLAAEVQERPVRQQGQMAATEDKPLALVMGAQAVLAVRQGQTEQVLPDRMAPARVAAMEAQAMLALAARAVQVVLLPMVARLAATAQK